jgi:hypothetical protein
MTAVPASRKDDWGEPGPAMRALANDRHRLFVELYLIETFGNGNKKNYGAQARAARKAGFGGQKTRATTYAQIGWKLMRDDRIIAAVAEESRKFLRAGAPEAVKAVLAGIRDPKHKDHARFVGMLLDRADPVMTEHKVTVERSEQTIVIATEEVLNRIRLLAMRAGLDPVKQIELTAMEVKDDEQRTA